MLMRKNIYSLPKGTKKGQERNYCVSIKNKSPRCCSITAHAVEYISSLFTVLIPVIAATNKYYYHYGLKLWLSLGI